MGKGSTKHTQKNETTGKDIKRLFKVLGLSLLIVLVLLALVSFLSNYTNLDLFGKKEESAAVPDGVIYRIDADNVRSMQPYQNGVVLLTNAAVQYLDASGREVSSNSHIYATPEMQICDKTVFLYDKGGTACRIEKNASVYREMTLPGTITCGAVGKRNNYAYSLDNHDGYQSHIFVYSAKGEKQFEWGSASDYCFRLALSDAGNKLAVCVVGVENAEYYSKVLLFTFNSGQPAYTVDFPGKTVFDLDFISGKKIAVYTDAGVYFVDADGQITARQEYAANEIEHSCVNNHGLSCTAVIPYGNEQTPLITVFDGAHKVLYTHQYNTLISGVVCSGSHVGVVMYDKVQILNRAGKVVGDILPGEACERYVIVNNNLYIVSGTGLHRYNIHFDTEKTETTAAYIPRIVRDQMESTSAPDTPSDAVSASDASLAEDLSLTEVSSDELQEEEEPEEEMPEEHPDDDEWEDDEDTDNAEEDVLFG